jgi:hypothetical protein
MHWIMLPLLMQVGVPPPTCGSAGWMLENLDGKEYGVEFVCRGGEAVITLQLLEGRKADGLPIWKTIAQRKIALAKGDGLLEGATCNLKGTEPDAEIVPIGHYTKGGQAKITRAFRASRAHKAIELLPAASVECEVEGD